MSDRLKDIMGRVPDPEKKEDPPPGDKKEEEKTGPDGKPLKSPFTYGNEWDQWKDKYKNPEKKG